MSNPIIRSDQSYELQATWWLPENPDRKVPGVLRYAPGRGVTVELGAGDNAGGEASGGLLADGDPVDVVHGTSDLGSAESVDVSLVRCGVSKQPTRRGTDESAQVLTAGVAVLGAHTRGFRETFAQGFTVSMENMSAWGSGSGDIVEAKVGTSGGLSARSEPLVTTSQHGEAYSLVAIPVGEGSGEETVAMRLLVEEPVTVVEALEMLRSVQNLISLSAQRPCGVRWIALHLVADDAASDQTVGVLASPGLVAPGDSSAATPARMALTCEQLPFARQLQTWPVLHSVLQPAVQMWLTSTRSATGIETESDLVLVLAAAESLHRAVIADEVPIEPSQFEKIKKKMLRAVPKDHTARLDFQIRNELTERQRLLHLAALIDPTIVGALIPDVEEWSYLLTGARSLSMNDAWPYDHHEPSFTEGDLIWALQRLRWVIALNILGMMGVDEDALVEAARQMMHAFAEQE